MSFEKEKKTIRTKNRFTVDDRRRARYVHQPYILHRVFIAIIMPSTFAARHRVKR